MSSTGERWKYEWLTLPNIRERRNYEILRFSIVEQKIALGKTVVVTAEKTGRKMTFRLVHAEEADINAGLLSEQSPLGSALIGSRVGDCVTVDAPAGKQQFSIVKISDS